MATAPVAETGAPVRYLQGIAVPATSVNPREFFARTRRKNQLEARRTFAGLGQTDIIELKKADILAGLTVRLSGTITIALPTGTAATTWRYPYDLIKAIRFTANGQSNIINVSGAKLKVREFMARADLNDRGISQSINNAAQTQGTLAQASESWGLGQAQTAIPAAAYSYDLEWFVPVAEDQVDLSGAIFAQTSSTDLTLAIDWAAPTDVFTLTGTATATMTGTLDVTATKYSIPLGPDGQIVIPDLSVFHSLLQSRTTALSNGENEIRLIGQGAGKNVLRVYNQLWNGATSAPLPVNATNYGRLAWRFGGNETPDDYIDGQTLRIFNERTYGVDIGRSHGFFAHEFAAENAFRDVVDLGTTSEWRQVINIGAGVALSSPGLETVVESIFAAGAGA